MQQIQISNYNKWYFVVIVGIAFFIFLSTSDGHRYTIDEDLTQQQSLWITTMSPDDKFILGESRIFFQYPDYFPNNTRNICINGILCSPASIGSSVVQVPFLFINHFFHLISQDTVVFTADDFTDPHYVYWRNSINPDFTFLELFFGPTLSAFGVGIFF